MKIYLGADHGGYRLKEKIKIWLTEWGVEFEDLGAHELKENDDYPDFASNVARKVAAEPGSLGILACRSGQGEAVAANKFKGIRAGVVWSEEVARAARNDDDVNVFCLASDYVGMAEQKNIVRAFLTTPFAAEERYVRRIDKIKKLEAHL